MAKKVFEESSTLEVFSRKIKVPSKTCLILHLLYHSTKKGYFDTGLRPLFDLNELLADLDDSEVKELIKEASFFSLDEEAKVFISLISKNTNEKNIIDKQLLLKEILVSPHINLRIQELAMESNFYQRVKKIFKLLFSSEENIRREFNVLADSNYKNFYFKRWKRQISQFGKYINIFLFQYKYLKKRAKLIKKFYS